MSDEGKVLAWRCARRKTAQAPSKPAQPQEAHRYPVWSEKHRRWAWRSDMPITPDRWQCAREYRGWSEHDVADRLGCEVAHILAVEAGTEQPTAEEIEQYGFLTGFRSVWFRMEPLAVFPGDGFNSLDLHAALVAYVCDPCERKTGEEVDADTRCADCGDDLCYGCTHLYERADGPVDLCERCWHKAIGQKAATTRRARRNTH